jgi:nucleoid-associated protein YgaU
MIDDGKAWRPGIWMGRLVLVLALVWGVTGCRDSAGRLDRLEEDTPMIRKAIERKRLGDDHGAISLYGKALDKDPTLARAHLELGFLLDHPTRDYVLAIYHYRRYLDIRPGTDKKEMIEDRIRMAKLALAASLSPTTSSGAERMMTFEKENAGLRQENDYLRNELADLRERMRLQGDVAVPTAPTASPSLVKIVPVPAPPLNLTDPGSSQVAAGEEGSPILDAPPPETSIPSGVKPPVASNVKPPVVSNVKPPANNVKPVARPVRLVSSSPVTTRTTSISSGKVKQYKVQKGDSLSTISMKVYGDTRRWRDIYTANRASMRNERDLRVGQVLRIPP